MTSFTCPMHAEVRQSGPGNCPKRGMVLEPESPSPAAGRTTQSEQDIPLDRVQAGDRLGVRPGEKIPV